MLHWPKSNLHPYHHHCINNTRSTSHTNINHNGTMPITSHIKDIDSAKAIASKWPKLEWLALLYCYANVRIIESSGIFNDIIMIFHLCLLLAKIFHTAEGLAVFLHITHLTSSPFYISHTRNACPSVGARWLRRENNNWRCTSHSMLHSIYSCRLS
jgi:hypothetical protein